jgi:hypothetical protein
VFAAKPATEYRGWVYVGACCAETFAFSIQGTELSEAIPVKNTITFLKKTHVEHGGPKEAKTWQWAELALRRKAVA